MERYKILLVILFIKISYLYSFPGNPYEQISIDTNAIRETLEKGWQFFQSNEYDSAHKYALRALELSQNWDIKEYIAHSNNFFGLIYTQKGDFRKALSHYSYAEEFFKKINHKKGLSAVFTNMGKVYKDIGNYSKAFDYFYQSLQIKKEIQDTPGIALVNYNLASLLLDMILYSPLNVKSDTFLDSLKKKLSDYALHYLQNAESLYLYLNDEKNLIGVYNNKALVYSNINLYDSAIKIIQKSYELAKKDKDLQTFALTLANMGHIWKLQGNKRKADSYYHQALKAVKNTEYNWAKMIINMEAGVNKMHAGLFDKALIHFDTLQQIAIKLNQLYYIGLAYYLKGRIYVATKKYSQAYPLLQKAIDVATIYSNTELLAKSHGLIALLDSLSNDIENAHINFQKFQYYHAQYVHEIKMILEKLEKPTAQLIQEYLLTDTSRKEIVENEKEKITSKSNKISGHIIPAYFGLIVIGTIAIIGIVLIILKIRKRIKREFDKF